MLKRTRSSNRLNSPTRETTGRVEQTKIITDKKKSSFHFHYRHQKKNVEDAENLPSPPSTPTSRRRTKSVLPETPQNVRNITKELQLAQLKSPSNNSTIYLKCRNRTMEKRLYIKKPREYFDVLLFLHV
ncbi:unnamed protein product [Mucor hiemalis]